MSDPTRAPQFATPVYLAPAPGTASKNITTDTSTLVHTGAGYVTGLVVNTPASGATVKLYDGTDNTGTLLGTFAASAQGTIPFPGGGIPFSAGLFVVTAVAAADITVTYVAS